jgi:hypothetical protein
MLFMSDEMQEIIEEPVEQMEPVEGEDIVEQEAADGKNDGGEEKDLRDGKGRFKHNGVQSRFNELTRKNHESERRARDAERRASYFEGLATQTAQNPAENAAKPTADQYDDYNEFVEALTDWKVAQKTQTMQSDAAKGVLENERKANYAERLEEAKSTIPDFVEVVGASDVTIANHVGELVMDSARGPEILYHLAQNPSLANTLNGLSERRAAMEIGRLEAQLEAPVVKRQSQAPAPISPISQGVSGKVNLDTADFETYVRERKKQGSRYY